MAIFIRSVPRHNEAHQLAGQSVAPKAITAARTVRLLYLLSPLAARSHWVRCRFNGKYPYSKDESLIPLSGGGRQDERPEGELKVDS
jgi:hypothetical protein